MAQKQQTLSDIEYGNRRVRTQRDVLLEKMNELLPWQKWIEEIRPHYYTGTRGRRPRNLETMLRMYLVKYWFGCSDEGIEDAIYDSYALRSFLKVDFLKEQVPDATTLGRFRHMLVKNGLDQTIHSEIDQILRENKLALRRGSFTEPKLHKL